MSSSAAESPVSAPRGVNPILERIIEARLSYDPVLEEVTRLAAGAEAAQVRTRARGLPRVTRTTLLWALAQRDTDVLEALYANGVGPQQLGQVLGVTGVIEPLSGSFDVATDLDAALRGLSQQRAKQMVGCRVLAQVLVRSVIQSERGVLGDRLRRIGVDPEALLRSLQSTRSTGTAGTAGTAENPVAEAATPELVRDVTSARFGIAMPVGATALPEYFPRDVDDELVAALDSRPPAVLVMAQAMSGAVRTVFEALRRACPDEMLLLAEELASSDDGFDPELLLPSGATIVWVPDLGRLARSAPHLGDWLARRRDAVQATVVAVVRAGDENLVQQVGLDSGAITVQMSGQLTPGEQSNARREFGREMSTISDVVRAALPRRAGQAAYLADSYDAFGRLTTENDALDITPDVRMLASLVASRQVQPPLSIGLFGPWGSGKSFLMHQVKLGAVDLAKRSAELGPEGESAYCSKIVTVDFNAWQYVHGVDLWASLVSRVFEGIRDQLDSTETYQKLWQDIRERSSDVASAQHELEAAEAELRSSSSSADKRPVATVAADDPVLEASAAILKKTIDLDPATTQISTLRSEVKDLRTVIGKFAKGWRGAGFLRRSASVVFFTLAIALVIWFVVGGLKAEKDVAALVAASVSLLTAVNALLKPARLALGAGVEILDADRLRYDDARRRRDQAADALAAARSHGPAALYGYVSDRSVAADYRQHLGMGPMIREDLSRLAWLAAPEGGTPTIDRIVIFIDDLDRCPAKDVVRVLEAVNLLFAHPLFVVVVAVDSRWLIESLKSEFSQVFTPDDAAAPTPQNYLEKIIQIPFWLQAVHKDGFGRLVTSLVGKVDDGPSDDVTPDLLPRERPMDGPGDRGPHPSVDVDSSPFHDPSPFHGPPQEPQPEPVRVDVPEPVAKPVVEVDLNPIALRITARERDYLRGFHDLVTTPRATKRFLNTYQLLRAGIRDVDAYLATEEYRAVLLLLALVTGTGLVNQAMVEELRGMQEQTFAEFLASRIDDERWGPVRPACADLAVDVLTPAVIDKWCARVARYSFHPIGR